MRRGTTWRLFIEATRNHALGMSWSALAEARMLAWLQTPEADRPKSSDEAGSAPPLELDLFQRLECAIEEARRTVDPAVREQAERRARDLETRLFTLLDATGRSILAPIWAARVTALRQAK